jgi:hypothetical protein
VDYASRDPCDVWNADPVAGASQLRACVGTWYEKHHEAQVAADGAALAAANCMANAGSSGDSCTSATDTTDATTVAETYASDNGVTITSSDISFNMTKDTVTVTTPNPAPAFFATIFGIHSTTPTANSTAMWSSEQASTCTTAEEAKGDCYALFAYDSVCSNDGVDVTTNNTVINGAIHSNGDISNNGNNNTKLDGPNSYGSGSGCKNPSGSKSVTEVQDPSPLCYPVDYSGLTPNPGSCGGTDASPAWTATSSYCTVTINSSATYTIPTSGGYLVPGVYCDTTSGTVNVSGSAASASAGVTVLAQNFSLTSAGALYPYTSSAATASNQLVLYQYERLYLQRRQPRSHAQWQHELQPQRNHLRAVRVRGLPGQQHDDGRLYRGVRPTDGGRQHDRKWAGADRSGRRH